jgi:imidazolonepropionase-like amidohydrolase
MASIFIKAGSLHHNTGGEPRTNVTLQIENGSIAAIGEALPMTEGALILEVRSVIPGLINGHVHFEVNGESNVLLPLIQYTTSQRLLNAAEYARKTLHSGVTTVRDCGSNDNISIDLRDAIDAGKLPGPSIFACGNAIAMTGGHGWFLSRQADGPDDVVKAVREQRRAGAQCIKFIATGGVLTKGAVPGNAELREDELAAGVAEAHRHGMRVTAHAIGAEGIKNALRAGVDSIEHGHMVDDEGIALFKERGAYLVPTIAAPQCLLEAGPGAGIPDFALSKGRMVAEAAAVNLRKARGAGVKFAGGSDAGTPFNYHDNYAYEIELMQSILGMTAREAIFTATAAAADNLGTDRGRLREGAAADLLLLDRDIDDSLAALRQPRAVLKSGEIVFERA